MVLSLMYREYDALKPVVLNLWISNTRKHIPFPMVLGTPNHKFIFITTS